MEEATDNFIITMYGRIRYGQYGKWRRQRYIRARKAFLVQSRYVTRCEECNIVFRKGKIRGGPQRRDGVTIDHVIPLWVCYEYAMPALEFDPRNFRLMCQTCNSSRGTAEMRFEDLQLSDRVKERLVRAKDRWAATRKSLLAGEAVLE